MIKRSPLRRWRGPFEKGGKYEKDDVFIVDGICTAGGIL